MTSLLTSRRSFTGHPIRPPVRDRKAGLRQMSRGRLKHRGRLWVTTDKRLRLRRPQEQQ